MPRRLAGRTLTTMDAAPGKTRMLFGDGIIAVLLLNEARHRILGQVYGLPRQDANVLSAFAANSAAGAARSGAARMRAVRPTRGDTMIATALLRESVYGIAGPWSRTTPHFGALLGLAIVGAPSHPVLRAVARGGRQTLHAAGAFSREAQAWLGGRD